MNKGFGDRVELAIKKTTFGKVKPKKGCGCNKRKQWLNDNVSYEKVGKLLNDLRSKQTAKGINGV